MSEIIDTDLYAMKVEAALDVLEAKASELAEMAFNSNPAPGRSKYRVVSPRSPEFAMLSGGRNFVVAAVFCIPGVEPWRGNRSTEFILEVIARTPSNAQEHYRIRAAMCRLGYRYIDWLKSQDRIGEITVPNADPNADPVMLPGLLTYRSIPMESSVENLTDPNYEQRIKDSWQGAIFNLSFHLCDKYPNASS